MNVQLSQTLGKLFGGLTGIVRDEQKHSSSRRQVIDRILNARQWPGSDVNYAIHIEQHTPYRTQSGKLSTHELRPLAPRLI